MKRIRIEPEFILFTVQEGGFINKLAFRFSCFNKFKLVINSNY